MITPDQFIEITTVSYAVSLTCAFTYLYYKYRALRSETDVPQSLIDTRKSKPRKVKRGDKPRKKQVK